MATSDQRLLVGVTASVVVLDAVSKWILTRHFEQADTPQSIELIGARVVIRLSENSGIAFGGSWGMRTINVTPALNQMGTTDITVTVSDGFWIATRTFQVTVGSVLLSGASDAGV